MQFIILDLEATCWQGNIMDRRQEIIELAAFRVNGYREWQDHFQRFVRPTDHPRLSAYCMELTGITQEQVNTSRKFDHVIHEFQDWLDAVDGPRLLCTWGDKDIDIIEAECARHDIPVDFLPKSIDLKAQYARLHRLTKESGLLKALEYHELEFEGSPHRAFDDAYNTARLFLHLLDQWQY
jgi:inhibitor of KinA sporulation pathway (predicted exonuclease)